MLLAGSGAAASADKMASNEEAWINVHGESHDIHPIVHVRVLNSSGEDVATRRRTPVLTFSSASLEWNFNETLELPLQKNGRSGLSLEFKVVTGDEWMEPIAIMKMPCSKTIKAAGSKNKKPLREVLLWNRKRALRRRFANSPTDAADAPPAVFYAGELIISVEYVRGDGNGFMAGSKTEIVPNGQVPDAEDYDRFVVTIKKIKALGDDGTSSKSSARVWGATLALLLYFTIGVLVYVYGESFTFVDSLWFCVATITTVGYGDVKPKTDGGKLFTAFYVLVGYVLVGVAVGMITAYIVDQQALKRKLMIQKAQALALGGEDEENKELMEGHDSDDLDLSKVVNKQNEEISDDINAAIASAAMKRKRKKECQANLCDWAKTVIPVILVVGLGMVVMMMAEGWTAVDSFYWALATGTTVGYGDISPKLEGTRLFGCFYVFMVVAVTARIVGKISDVFLSGDGARDVQAILGKKPDAAWLRSLDTDGSGDVTEIEYLSAMLVRLQYVEQDKIDQILKAFHKLDTDDSGTLSIEDLVDGLDKKNDNDDDENEEEEKKVVAPGGRYSFSGPIGGLIVSPGTSGITSLKNKIDASTADMINEAEQLLETPETESSGDIDVVSDDKTANVANVANVADTADTAVVPNTNTSALDANKNITSSTTPLENKDNENEKNVDTRQEIDIDTNKVIEEATKVLENVGGGKEEALAPPVQAVADEADENGEVLGHCVAMYDFNGEESGELGFKRGDVLDVTELDNSDGWWHGSLNGAWGSFPFGYVYCNLEKDGVKYLLLPRDWAVHESDGDKTKIGTFDYLSKKLTDAEGKQQDWSNATLM